jgi:biotin synthase
MANDTQVAADPRWHIDDVIQLFNAPFMELLDQAHAVHKENHNPSYVQISTLLSIKTGGCPENCSYCPQSAHFKTKVKKEPLMEVEEVVAAAKKAKEAGASRFCMGAAWRGPNEEDLAQVTEMVKQVKALGMETCATLGLLEPSQANQLADAGLDYYNHNIDTSEDYYSEIITTRCFDDRVKTLDAVDDAGINVCCGGILGMGESVEDRAKMLTFLANRDKPPMSVPINQLIAIPGTPLANQSNVDSFDFVRTIAVARILLPKSAVRLSAGREQMNEELQALCFFAGANSIFYGEKLLTAENPVPEADQKLFERLNLTGQK